MEKSMFYKERAYYTDIQRYILDCCDKYGENVFCRYLKKGEVMCKTYSELLQYVNMIGNYLYAHDFKNKHIALLGKTSFEWIATYLAALSYGVVVVPIDKALSNEEILKQIEFSDSEMLFFDPEYIDVAEYVRNTSFQCDSFVMLSSEERSSEFDTLKSIANNNVPAICIPALNPESLAEIVFTSGTTGNSKGVMLSNKNIVSTVMFGIRLVDMSPDDVVLSIMPNNHTYELSVGIMTPMYFGMSIAINDSLKRFKQNFLKFKPTTMIGVPALLHMVKNQIVSGIESKGKKNKFIIGQKISKLLRVFGIDIRRKLFSDIIDGLGGELKSLICGGAFLSDELMGFYDSIGINIIQGYGITECSPIVSCNTDRKTRKLGEVGPYCTVKCVDGEICVSGDNVMIGYYKNPEETQKVIIDGWFHTGDLGYVDNKNCLSLSGRIKNLIINSNGENVSPEEIENHLAFIDLFANAVVYGEDDLIAVEIYPNFSYVEANGIVNVESEIHKVIDEVNKKLPRKMHIERIHIRKEPFDMTTTMKIKRHNLKNK